MARLKISFACGLYDRMQALYTGDVVPENIDLDFRVLDAPRDIFDRMAGRQEFDAAEMSLSEFVARHVAGASPFVAIPVFPSRMFRHGLITINRRSGIRTPKDLEGKRVGVPLYTMSAAVWIRGHLRHQFGVDLDTIHWVQGSINGAGSHGTPSVLPMARERDIAINDGGRTLSDLLEADEIDAIVGTTLPAAIKRDPDICRLFPDFRAVEKAYFRETRIFPIMHLLAIRRDVHEAHPFVAASLYKAMCDAKAVALTKMRNLAALRYMVPWLADDLDEMDALFGDDPWPYGIEANRPTLEAFCTYMVEQGIVAHRPDVDDLFVATSETSITSS